MNNGTMTFMRRVRAAAIELGPYAGAAIFLPGGSLIAALTWLYRRSKHSPVHS